MAKKTKRYEAFSYDEKGKETSLGKYETYGEMKEALYTPRAGCGKVCGTQDGVAVMWNHSPGVGLPAAPAPKLTEE